MKKTIYHITLALCLLGGIGLLTLRRLDRAYPPDITTCNDHSPAVYDRHGALLHSYLTADGKRRLPPGALPAHYTALLLNYEDRRYYQHHGIDPRAVIRALGENLRGGGIRSGASTLTMQAARLIYHTPHTLSGKIRQTLRALQLETHYDKTTILRCYASLAPMGGNLEGIGSGAWYYFGKTPAELSTGEAAWLIALPQNPNRLADPDRARAARNRVLDRALKNHTINNETHHNASHEPLAPAPHSFPQHAPHYAALALKRGESRTTLDRNLQTRLETILAAAVQNRPPRSNLAALILDNDSGETRAYLGSAAYHDKTRLGANNLLTAIRSPGSALKPYITLYALDHYHLHPHTPIDDTPLDGPYNPDNYDQKYLGRITLGEALQRSRNTPAVRLLERIGPDTFAAWLEQHGLHLTTLRNSPPNLTLALGGVGIRATELAALYRQLANCTYRPEKPAPPTAGATSGQSPTAATTPSSSGAAAPTAATTTNAPAPKRSSPSSGKSPPPCPTRRVNTVRRRPPGTPAKTPSRRRPRPRCASPRLPTTPPSKTAARRLPCKPTAASRPTPGLPTANCYDKATARKPCGNRPATATTTSTSATNAATMHASTSACKPRRKNPPPPCAYKPGAVSAAYSPPNCIPCVRVQLAGIKTE